MKLTLKNVKQHADREFEFPNSGLILLKGPSGTGKSTIFEAITDALYGDADDITTWEMKTSKIILDFMGIKIERTHGPDYIQIENSKFEGPAAYGYIQKTLGMNQDEFNASSYIRQKGAESLLSLKPTAQLNFIQRLVAGSSDPEKIKKIINSKVTARSSALASQEQVEGFIDVEISELEGKLKEMPTLPPPVCPCTDEEMQQVKNRGIALDDQLSGISGRLKTLSLLQGHPIHGVRSKLQTISQQLSETTARIDGEIAQLNANLASNEASKPTESIEEIAEKIKTINSQFQYLTIYEQIQVFVKEVQKIYSDAPDKQISGFLVPKRDTVEKQIGVLVSEIGTLDSDLKIQKRAKNIKKCPLCEGDVRIVGDCIEPAHISLEEIEHKINALQVQITDKSIAKDLLVAELKRLNTFIMNAQALKMRIQGAIPTTLTTMELHAELANTQEKAAKHQTYLQEKTSAEAGIKLIKSELAKQTESHKILCSQLSQMEKENIPALDEVAKLAQSEQETFDSFTKEKKQLSDITYKYSTYQFLARQYSEKQSVADGIRDRIAELKVKDEAQSRSVDIAKKNLAAAIRLKEVSNKSAVEAIENIVGNINANAKFYIEAMFPNGGTEISLRNKRVLQNGEERPDISLSIFHKGCKVKRLSSLSGGEYSRLILAFQLALSDLYRSPILLVDEGFTGLDSETQTICMESLKAASTNKLILVIEHNCPEYFFDGIIDV